MYTIPIDEQNYHLNALSAEEHLWAKTTYLRVLKQYTELKSFIKSTLKPLNLTDDGTSQLMVTVTLAFCHTMKTVKQPNSEKQLDKTIKSWIHAFLPYIVDNLMVARYSHPIQFEPIALSCHYLSTTFQNKLLEIDDSAFEALSEFENVLLAEFVNVSRTIRSSVALFSIGDDVHGISLFRGALEIFAKISLAKNFSEEYVLFKKFNVYRQLNLLQGDPIPQEMTDYLKEEPLYRKNPESFLAYGWIKNAQGKRILTMNELLRLAFENGADLISWVHLASEFTHEDYVGIEYDYKGLRKAMTDHYYFIYRSLSFEAALEELLPKKEIKKIRHLQNLADPIYTGPYPLSGIN